MLLSPSTISAKLENEPNVWVCIQSYLLKFTVISQASVSLNISLHFRKLINRPIRKHHFISGCATTRITDKMYSASWYNCPDRFQHFTERLCSQISNSCWQVSYKRIAVPELPNQTRKTTKMQRDFSSEQFCQLLLKCTLPTSFHWVPVSSLYRSYGIYSLMKCFSEKNRRKPELLWASGPVQLWAAPRLPRWFFYILYTLAVLISSYTSVSAAVCTNANPACNYTCKCTHHFWLSMS